MKKLIVIAVLTAILSGAVFAQELRLDGYINSGIGWVTSEDSNEETQNEMKAYAVDAGQHGYRFRLNGSYTNEAKNAGVRFRFQSQNGTSTSDREFISLPYAFGWMSFVNNMITVNAGIIEDSTWSTGDFWLASDSVSNFSGLGALLKLAPIDGLVLGAGAYTVAREGGSRNNTLNLGNFGTAAKIEDIRYTFHAVYTMPDMFRIGGSFRTESEGIAARSQQNYSMAYIDFRLLAIKDLTFAVGVHLDNLEGLETRNEGDVITTLSETFAYKINNIDAGLNAVQFLYKNNENDIGLFFNVWASMAFNNVIPRLDLVYFMNGSSNTAGGGDNAAWGRGTAFAYSSDKDQNLFSIRPSVRINLDSRTHIEIGDLMNFDIGKYDGKTETLFSNVFYIDLKWSF